MRPRPSAAAPDLTDRMDYVPGLEAIAAGDFGETGVAAAQGLALGQQLGAGGTMDGAVDAAAAEQRGVGSVDDGVDVERLMSATQFSSRDAPTLAVSRGRCHARHCSTRGRRRIGR